MQVTFPQRAQAGDAQDGVIQTLLATPRKFLKGFMTVGSPDAVAVCHGAISN